jgi:hypothetical protein
VAKADEFDIDELRDRAKIAEIIDGIERQEQLLTIAGETLREVKGYIKCSSFMPKRINVEHRKSVDAAQEAIYRIQARLDRLLAIHVDISRVNKMLGQLEILARQDLARAKVLGKKSSAAAAKLIVSTVIPELAEAQLRWASFEKLCSQVQDHLGEAKSSIRMQTKLDENANWARRYGA